MTSYLINHHPGSTITYNLHSARRFKGRDGTKVPEKWKTEKDLQLVLRLKVSSDDDECSPWLVSHHGHVEIFRSKIFSAAAQNVFAPEVVHVVLHNWARRRGNPITRKYGLTFHSAIEAKSFVSTFNLFLEDAKKKQEKNVEEHDTSDDKDKIEDGIIDVWKECNEGGGDNDTNGEGGEDNDANGEEEGDIVWDVLEENTQDPFSEYISD